MEYDGIKFRSKLEVYCYTQLQEHNIKAEYESTVYTLVEAFKFNGENVRKMTYKPDFVSDTFVIECKGRPNDAFPLRWKLFKYYLYKNNINLTLYLPRNRKDVDAVIQNILDND